MRIRFYNVKICSMESDMDITTGEIWTSGGRVEYIGKAKPSTEAFTREIDGEGNLILPGFKNGHTHSAMTFLRSYADDMPLLDWLEHQVFPMEAKLKDGMVYIFSKLAILEYLSSGITANFDMYMYPLEIAQASIDMGFRTVICTIKDDVRELENTYNKLNKINPLITSKIGFHAEYTTSTNTLMEISRFVNHHKLSVHTHNSESKKEVEDCIKRTGKTPTERVTDLGLYNYGGTTFHGIFLTNNDMDLHKKHNISVVTNPGSNVKLASGIAPVTALLENGITVGIGTDGPASNNSLDMFWEMKLATSLQKIKNNDASALPAAQVLKMACVDGANIMGLKDSNCLGVGKNADLIMIDLNRPNMQPLNNILTNVVYAGSKINVKMTMIGGKILYEDGKYYINDSEEEIYKKTNEIVKSII